VTSRIVVAGNLSLDDTVGPAGFVAEAAGGDALYASLGVRVAGATAVLLTLVGDDYPSEHVERMLAAGIDVSHLRRTTGPTVHYRVTNDANGARTYEWISTPDRLLLTSPEATDYATLDGADWLHVAAMPIEAQEVAVKAARAAGVPFSLDPHEEYVVGFEARLARLIDGAVFMPSELEVRLLFPDLARLPPLELVAAAFVRLEASRPALVAVKLGDLGSVVWFEGRTVHVPAPPVPVVDSTGAGDAYCGAFVAAWLGTRSPAVAAACGTVAAGEIIGGFGAFRDEPSPDPMERLRRVRAVLSGIDPNTVGADEATAALSDLARAMGVGVPV
jgi:ribokinase